MLEPSRATSILDGSGFNSKVIYSVCHEGLSRMILTTFFSNLDGESLSFLLFQIFLLLQRLFLSVSRKLLSRLNFGLGLHGVVLRMRDLEVLSAHHLHLH